MENAGKQRRWHCLFLFLLAFLLYGNTLNHGYVLDDSLFVNGNNFVQKGFEGIQDIWTNDAFVGAHGRAFDLTGGRYRPLAITMFAIEYEWFGNNPFPGHLLNIIFYGLTGVMIYLLLLRLFHDKNEWLPLIAATLFMVHPIHTEVVANIKSRDEIMVLLFALTSMWLMLKEKRWPLIWSVLLFLCALLSKENAITMLAIIPLNFYFFRGNTLRQSLLKLLPFVGITIFYLLLRTYFAGTFGERSATNVMDNPYLYASFAEKYATIIAVCGKYLAMLVYPYPLSFDYSYHAISLVNWLNWKPLLSLTVYGGLIYYALRNFHKKSWIVYGIIWYMAAFSIVSNVFFNIGAPMGERFIYLSSLGFCIALAAVTTQILKIDLQQAFAFKRKSVLPLLLILPLASWVTVNRNPAWKSNYSLYETDVQTVPNSARARMFYGIELLGKFYNTREKHYLEKSIAEIETACRINPEFYHAFYNLGLAYQAGDMHLKAIKAFERVLEIQPRHINSHYYLGMSYGKGKGEIDKAIEFMEKGLKYGYNGDDAYVNLGISYAMKKDYQKAIEVFQKGLTFQPQKAELYLNLGITYQNLGNQSKADSYMNKAFELNPALRK